MAISPATTNNFHSASYGVTDLQPAGGWNYYRVKSVDMSGKLEYTEVVKVLVAADNPIVSVYPNPIVNSTIHIQMRKEPAGLYTMRLTNGLGQVMLEKSISHAGGTAGYELQLLPGMARGIYHLEMNNTVIGSHTIKIVY